MRSEASVLSVNVAVARDNRHKSGQQTGIDKRPAEGPVEVRSPGSRHDGLGSGLVGDFVGDRRHHGGDDQAVYAYAVEDLHWWAGQLSAAVDAGRFGENLTTHGVDVSGAVVGERWAVGADVVLQVTDPRIPCGTFRGYMDRPGWLKTFTRAARPGSYLRVVTPGTVCRGDRIEIMHRPDHGVTVSMVLRALTTEPELLPQILAAPELVPETRHMAEAGKTFSLR